MKKMTITATLCESFKVSKTDLKKIQKKSIQIHESAQYLKAEQRLYKKAEKHKVDLENTTCCSEYNNLTGEGKLSLKYDVEITQEKIDAVVKKTKQKVEKKLGEMKEKGMAFVNDLSEVVEKHLGEHPELVEVATKIFSKNPKGKVAVTVLGLLRKVAKNKSGKKTPDPKYDH